MTGGTLRLALVLVVAFASSGAAQLAPGVAQSAPATVVPDTVTAEIRGPRGWPTPAAVRIWPALPRFGEVATLLLDFPDELPEFSADSLATDAGWLDLPAAVEGGPWWHRLFGGDDGSAELAADAPAPEGDRWRAVVPLRVYAAGPARIVWRDGPQTDVFPVRGRLGATEENAPVRDPRDLGWYAWRIAAVVLIVLGLLGLGLWLRRRLRRGAAPVDRPLPVPGWIAAALALWRLDQADLPARGDGREFLDRLAAILRAYLGARFYLPACESTAAELRAAIVGSGWPDAPLDDFVSLIAAADSDRYAPGRIDAARCRADLARAVALIAAVRIEPHYTPVAAALRIDAEAAWSGLCRRHLGAAGGEVAA